MSQAKGDQRGQTLGLKDVAGPGRGGDGLGAVLLAQLVEARHGRHHQQPAHRTGEAHLAFVVIKCPGK